MNPKHPFRAMDQALAMAHRGAARGEVPVGAALIGPQGQLLARFHNLTQRWNQPMAHAETLCVLRGQRQLRTPFLHDCTLYVTLQPCPLCFQVLAMARVGQVYFGAYRTAADEALSWPRTIIGGIHETACRQILSSFFQEQRRRIESCTTPPLPYPGIS